MTNAFTANDLQPKPNAASHISAHLHYCEKKQEGT